MTRYYVTTWDAERKKFTPQKGVRTGPYRLFALRKALRTLRGMGYSATKLPRCHYPYAGGDPSVLVESRETGK